VTTTLVKGPRREIVRVDPDSGQLDVALNPPHFRIFRNRRRFQSLIAGRRFGKTVLILLWCLARLLAAPFALVWYIAPTYRMARDIAWDLLLVLIPKAYIARTNDTRLEVRLRNGSRLALHGAENYARLKGRGLTAAALDEYPYLDREVWVEAILPALADNEGDALLAGTPVGYNWAYDLHMMAARDPEWASWSYSTLDGGYVRRREIDRQRSLMDPRTFRQEYEASFESLTGRVYDFFAEENIRDAIADPFEGFIRALLSGAPRNLIPAPPPLYVGFDFNISPMTYVAGIRGGDDGAELHIVDAGEVPTSNTEEVAAHLRAKYPDRMMIACPDPSGKRRSTNAAPDLTDHNILRAKGFMVRAPNAAPRVVDRINAVQALCRDGNGRRRLLVSRTTAGPLVKALQGLTYREGMNVPDPKSPLIHITDALGYLVWSEFNLLTGRAWQTSHFPLG